MNLICTGLAPTNLILWCVIIICATALLITLTIIRINNTSKAFMLQLKQKHEEDMANRAFEREKFWAFYKDKKAPIEEELAKAKNDLEELQRKEKELDDGISQLEKERMSFDKKILEAKIKAYEEIIKNKQI